MKLVKVQIQNFRSIKKVTFDVGDLCALIGPNNAGKSNILNALSYLLGDTWPTTRPIDPGGSQTSQSGCWSILTALRAGRQYQRELGK